MLDSGIRFSITFRLFLALVALLSVAGAPFLKPINATRRVAAAPSAASSLLATPLPHSKHKLPPNSIGKDPETAVKESADDFETGTPFVSKQDGLNAVMGFLQKFGYLDRPINNSEALFSEGAVFNALRTMQRFGGLEPTGVINNQTLQLLLTPRCGNKDVDLDNDAEAGSGKRKKRFVIGSPGWNKRRLTYFLANWSPKIGSVETTVAELQRAFQVWADYAHLKFVQVFTPDADIVVLFGQGQHGDRFPFDGPGYTLAHAYYPYEYAAFGGDVHFDEDEPWAVNPRDPSSGVDFFTVAVHELGHSLGLSHSPVPGSIMFPYYKGHQPNLQLDYDDILAMYQLYISRHVPDDRQDDVGGDTTTVSALPPPATTTIGPESTTVITTRKTTDRTTSPPTTRRHIHRDDAYDEYDNEEESTAVTTTTKKSVTINYEGDYESVDDHRRKWNGSFAEPEVPNVPDICLGSFDAVSVLRHELFVFKDQYVWRLRERSSIDYGYPTHIRNLFRELPNSLRKIDAVYERPDGNIVFFSGARYWVFNGDRMIEDNYPVTRLGLPDGLDSLDAAVVWGKNKKTYFFRKNLYWRYDEKKETMDPDYPRDLSRWRGVPTDIDAAMQWTDGKTYFFKKKLYWRFDDALVKTDIRYPLSAPHYWLGCPE